jgi:hypothetical protein
MKNFTDGLFWEELQLFPISTQLFVNCYNDSMNTETMDPFTHGTCTQTCEYKHGGYYCAYC